MPTRNVPDGDSVELYFTMPSTNIATATMFNVEAKYLGTNQLVSANNLFVAMDEEAFVPIQSSRFNVRPGAHHFYVCVRLNVDQANLNGDRVEVKITPQNNLVWFKDLSFTASAVLTNRFIDSTFNIPLAISTEEGEWETISGNIVPVSDKPINFNCKITHVTTNSTTLDGIQISVDEGVTWTNTLNNINFVLPANRERFLLKYLIKANQVEEGSRYFDITTTETTAVKVLKPNVNVKTRVTTIDTTRLNYGDLISTYCNGRDLYGIYSDGNGGRYEEPIIINAATCGSVIVPPDTVLSTFCAGTTRVQHKSDGAGGYYRQVLAYDSPACGYTTPTVNPNTTVTPTVLNPTRKGSTVILNPEGDVFGALLRDNSISNYSTRFGQWYFEVEVYLPSTAHLEVGMGFGDTTLNMAEWIGANNKSWSWWPYDSTKYHNDVQGIYAQLIDVVDGDVIGVMLDMENFRFGFSINGVFQGWCFDNLTDVKMHFLIAGRFDSWAFVNFGKYAFKHTPPAGFYHGFGTITNPPPERGTIISYFCVDVNRWVRKADGRGGLYEEFVVTNSPLCGWVDPMPPAGTVIGFVCDGFSKFNKIADGVGGFTLTLSEINSLTCGYVPPSEGGLSNVLIYNAGGWIDPAIVLTGDKLSYTNLHKTIIADWGNLSGIWYWELNDWTGEQYVGFAATDSNPLNTGIWGTIGVAIDPLTGQVNNRNVKETLFTPVAEGTPIGFKIDFKEQKITCYVGSESFVITTALNYPASSSNRLYPSVTSKVNGANGTFNFGQLPFHYDDGNSNKAYQKPTSPFLQRGTAISYQCDHWTRYVSRADGNGGQYTELFENDSATCGWYPDPPIGTILGYYCIGYARWRTVANGNYTTITVLEESQSVECGYLPAGTIISLYCIEKDQWATKSDGNDGTYEELVKINSSSCGFADSDDDFSDQEPDPRFNINHTGTLPVIGYDIEHNTSYTPPLPLATLISQNCDGYTLVTVRADGVGGTNTSYTNNSVDCGFGLVLPATYDEYITQLAPLANWKLNETSGTVAEDIAGSMDGEIRGTVLRDGPPLRTGASMSMGFGITAASTAKVHVPANTKLAELMSKQSTIIVWVRNTSNNDTNRFMSYFNDPSAGTGGYMSECNNSNHPTYIFGSSTNIGRVPFTLPLNQTSMVAFRRTENRFNVFVNGVFYYATADAYTITSLGTVGLQFTGYENRSNYQFRGYMSDASIFERSLTDGEITALYNLGKIV